MHKYEIILYWSDERQTFIAEVPELLGCMANRGDQEIVLRNANDAIHFSDRKGTAARTIRHVAQGRTRDACFTANRKTNPKYAAKPENGRAKATRLSMFSRQADGATSAAHIVHRIE